MATRAKLLLLAIVCISSSVDGGSCRVLLKEGRNWSGLGLQRLQPAGRPNFRLLQDANEAEQQGRSACRSWKDPRFVVFRRSNACGYWPSSVEVRQPKQYLRIKLLLSRRSDQAVARVTTLSASSHNHNLVLTSYPMLCTPTCRSVVGPQAGTRTS